MKKMILLPLLCLTLLTTGAQADTVSSSRALTGTVSIASLLSFGTTTLDYCSDETKWGNAVTVRELFKELTICLIKMTKDSGALTGKSLRATGRAAVKIPEGIIGTSEGTTEGTSGSKEEQKAMIEAQQESLLAVLGGQEPSPVSLKLIAMKRAHLARELGEGAAAQLSSEDLAVEALRDLEALRVEL